MNKPVNKFKKPFKSKMCLKSETLLSDVDVMLSQVNLLFSEINQKMSRSQVPVQSKLLLPRLEVILSEITWLVSLSQDCSSSSADLSWDQDHDYYVYSEDDDHHEFNINFSDVSACRDERVLDAPDSVEERTACQFEVFAAL